MSYRTILSLAAAAFLSAACISTISTDALARAGGRVGVHHARVGVHQGGVAHRGVYRGVYVRQGVAPWGVGAAAVGAAAAGAVAARAYDYDYGPSYYGDTRYYYQRPYYDNPYKHWTEF